MILAKKKIPCYNKIIQKGGNKNEICFIKERR